jgi:hypothetical protein
MNQRDKDDLAEIVFSALGFLLFGAIFLIALALGTRIAWNMVIPEVFGLPPLTVRNAFGLVGLGVAFRCFPVLSKE